MDIDALLGEARRNLGLVQQKLRRDKTLMSRRDTQSVNALANGLQTLIAKRTNVLRKARIEQLRG